MVSQHHVILTVVGVSNLPYIVYAAYFRELQFATFLKQLKLGVYNIIFEHVGLDGSSRHACFGWLGVRRWLCLSYQGFPLI